MRTSKENSQNELIKVSLAFSPLGDISVTWTIPASIQEKFKEFTIEVPGYKYDYPKFLSIPVPLSSKAFPVYTKVIESDDYTIEKEDGEYGNKLLKVSLIKPTEKKIELNYKVVRIMNADGVFFVVVYPFKSPFLGYKHRISINAKFSYLIRNYVFRERYFLPGSNKQIGEKKEFTRKKLGDEFKAQGEFEVNSSEVIDLHLTGTRLWFGIRRDRFWLIVYLILLSPFILQLIKLFEEKCNPGNTYNYNLFNF